MEEFIFAAGNNRKIPKEDMIFGIKRRETEMMAKVGKENVVSGTIGALLDDIGELIVLTSVDKVNKKLLPSEYASYAPIGGLPKFKEAAIKAAFMNKMPKGEIRAVATPGGTGALYNSIANYSEYGDSVLTTDWFWSPYNTIAGQQGRKITTFRLFDEKRQFNVKDFREKVEELLEKQDRLVIILNTPAQNPTGYSLTEDDWQGVINVLNSQNDEKKITLVVDTAYIDFAGDAKKVRNFLPLLENFKKNILTIIAFSMSKTFTMYGMRCGAMICVAKSKNVADEFVRVCEYSSRGSWSNSPKAGQSIISKIFEDEDLVKEVTKERVDICNMLLNRGRIFEKEAEKVGLDILPYCGGFFISIPCDDPVKVSMELEKVGIFLVPLAKGIRVSIASIPEEICKELPSRILAVMDK